MGVHPIQPRLKRVCSQLRRKRKLCGFDTPAANAQVRPWRGRARPGHPGPSRPHLSRPPVRVRPTNPASRRMLVKYALRTPTVRWYGKKTASGACPLRKLYELGTAVGIGRLRASMAAPSRRAYDPLPGCAFTNEARGPNSVSCLVFLNDRSRNTSSLAHLVAPLAGPLPNFRAALAARTRARLASPRCARDTPCMLDVSGEAVVQFLSVRGAYIDLVCGAGNRERNCLVPFDLAIVR